MDQPEEDDEGEENESQYEDDDDSDDDDSDDDDDELPRPKKSIFDTSSGAANSLFNKPGTGDAAQKPECNQQ